MNLFFPSNVFASINTESLKKIKIAFASVLLFHKKGTYKKNDHTSCPIVNQLFVLIGFRARRHVCSRWEAGRQAIIPVSHPSPPPVTPLPPPASSFPFLPLLVLGSGHSVPHSITWQSKVHPRSVSLSLSSCGVSLSTATLFFFFFLAAIRKL